MTPIAAVVLLMRAARVPFPISPVDANVVAICVFSSVQDIPLSVTLPLAYADFVSPAPSKSTAYVVPPPPPPAVPNVALVLTSRR